MLPITKELLNKIRNNLDPHYSREDVEMLLSVIDDMQNENNKLRSALEEIVWLPDGNVYGAKSRQASLLEAATIANNALKNE